MINDKVKLSRVNTNCGGKLGAEHAHIQSMLWCTDEDHLNTILSACAIYDCEDQLSKTDGRAKLIIGYKLGLSRAIMKAVNQTFHWKIKSIVENAKFGLRFGFVRSLFFYYFLLAGFC